MLSCSPSLLEFAHRQPAGSANSHSRRQTRKNAAFRAGRTPVKAGLYSGCSDPRNKLAQGTTNHLYSVSAITNLAGQVVERYSYNAYGVRTVKSPANVVIAKSAVNSDRGFTSYKLDAETGLYAARARQYSPTLGRFVGRDSYRSQGDFFEYRVEGSRMFGMEIAPPIGGESYHDGMGLYSGVFVPNKLDPSGYAGCTPTLIWKCDAQCKAIGQVSKDCTIIINCGVRVAWCHCDGACPPCTTAVGTKFNKVTDSTHDHGGCLAKTGVNTHWHYDVMNQDPKTCKCFHAKHQFGGCGMAPP